MTSYPRLQGTIERARQALGNVYAPWRGASIHEIRRLIREEPQLLSTDLRRVLGGDLSPHTASVLRDYGRRSQ